MEEQDNCDLTISDKFQEPKKKFWLRSRKRPKSDAISINSMDISLDSTLGKRKKRRKITEVASSFFAAASGKSLDRTITASEISFSDAEPTPAKKKIRISNEYAGNVAIRSWMIDVAELDIASTLSRREIKRQEAIYELFCGENVLLNDLCVLRDFFYQPLQTTSIFTVEELDTLFGDVSKFIQIHGRLRDEMVELRDRSGFTECLGPTFVDWLAELKDLYVERCRTQIWARHILESKKFSCKRFQEFLKKKSETVRTTELWTYLDVPRSRIVKYPLLVTEILRHTPAGHVDEAALKRAKELLSELLKEIDEAMGDAECKLAQTRINARTDYDTDDCIDTATDLITEGYLKDQKGTKYYCFLFNTCFAITRSNRRPNSKYNLCFPVIPPDQLSVQIVTPNKAAVSFKIGDHVLLCDDEHHRRHWLDSFKRLSQPRFESRRKQSSATPNGKGKENEPEVPECIKNEINRRSKNGHDGYFTISLRKTWLRHTRNSIDNT